MSACIALPPPVFFLGRTRLRAPVDFDEVKRVIFKLLKGVLCYCIYVCMHVWVTLARCFFWTHTSAHQSTLMKSLVGYLNYLRSFIMLYVCMHLSIWVTLPRFPVSLFSPQDAHVCAPVDSEEVTRVSQTTSDCLSCMYVCI